MSSSLGKKIYFFWLWMMLIPLTSIVIITLITAVGSTMHE